MSLRIAAVQQEGNPGRPDENREKALGFADEALSQGADVVLFHEEMLLGCTNITNFDGNRLAEIWDRRASFWRTWVWIRRSRPATRTRGSAARARISTSTLYPARKQPIRRCDRFRGERRGATCRTPGSSRKRTSGASR